MECTGSLQPPIPLNGTSGCSRLVAAGWAWRGPWGSFTDIAASPAGGIVVTGWSGSPAFPVLHPVQGVRGADGCFDFGCHDAVAARFSAAGALEWSTYLGGEAEDEARALAIDGESVLLAGSSASADSATPRAGCGRSARTMASSPGSTRGRGRCTTRSRTRGGSAGRRGR